MAQPTPLLDRLAEEDPQLFERLQNLTDHRREAFDQFFCDLETRPELSGVLRSLRRHWQEHMQRVLHTVEPRELPPGLPPALREQLYTDLCHRAGIEPRYIVPPEQSRLSLPEPEPVSAPEPAPISGHSFPDYPIFANRSALIAGRAVAILATVLLAVAYISRVGTIVVANDGDYALRQVTLTLDAHADGWPRSIIPQLAPRTTQAIAVYRVFHLQEVSFIDARGGVHTEYGGWGLPDKIRIDGDNHVTLVPHRLTGSDVLYGVVFLVLLVALAKIKFCLKDIDSAALSRTATR